MDRGKLIDDLAAAVGRQDVLHARRDLLVYAYDAEEERQPPDAVVFPDDAAETARVVQAARKAGLPAIVRGAGTNLSGGTLAVRGGVVVEISRMQRVLRIDLDNRRVVAEPGVINLDLQNVLARHGYFYGPDPASQKVSTLGGNVGENAGGPHCLKYGVTSNHVLGAEAVLADGQVVELGGPLEDNPGYDLTGLFVGSEGTLGIATRLTLRILRSPESIRTLLVIFDRLEDAGAAVSAIVAAGMVPATLELMDQMVIKAIEANKRYGFPLDAAGILLIEVDGLEEELDRQAAQISELCYQARAREVRLAKSAAERDALWAGRRGAFGAIARVTPAYVVQDGTVPRTILASMLGKVNEIAARHDIQVANVAHAGDGNLHPLFMFDPRKPGETERVHAAAAEILEACVAAGGTLTGEHGIGVAKQASMPVQFGPAELRLLAQVKRTFDPDELMNPGKIFPGELPEALTPALSQKEREQALTPPSAPLSRSAGEGSGVRAALSSLAAIRSGTLLTSSDDLAPYRVGALHPIAVSRPALVEEAQAAVRAAAAAGAPVVPWGRGTHQTVGRVRPTEALVLDLGGLHEILELDAGNQTVRVQAGVTLPQLQAVLAPERLFCPLDPDDAERTTVGGLIAMAASGPRRLGYGLPRDLVLGLRAIAPDGDLIRAGGKTMKDVAGYDLRKLFIGSWGTLGAVVEATLRLYPLPEARSALAVRFPDAARAGSALRAILASPLMPVALELVNGALWPADAPPAVRLESSELLLLVGLEGRAEAVARLEHDLSRLVWERGEGKALPLRGEEVDALWTARGHLLAAGAAGTALQARFSLPISRVADLFAAAPPGLGLVAHAGSGVGRALLPLDGDAAGAVTAFQAIRSRAEAAGGFAYLERGPTEVLEAHGGLPRRGDYALMRRLRALIDPGSLFNPGRVFESAGEMAEAQ